MARRLSEAQEAVLEDLKNVQANRQDEIPVRWPFLQDHERFPPKTMLALIKRRELTVFRGRLIIDKVPANVERPQQPYSLRLWELATAPASLQC